MSYRFVDFFLIVIIFIHNILIKLQEYYITVVSYTCVRVIHVSACAALLLAVV